MWLRVMIRDRIFSYISPFNPNSFGRAEREWEAEKNERKKLSRTGKNHFRKIRGRNWTGNRQIVSFRAPLFLLWRMDPEIRGNSYEKLLVRTCRLVVEERDFPFY